MHGGGRGVEVFFVLSGYLITTMLRDGVDLRDFFVRRARRLYPALLALLAVYLLSAPFIWPGQPHVLDAALVAGYVSNVSVMIWDRPKILSHTWSLATEAQFYLIWPFVLPLILRWKPVPILCALWVGLTLARYGLPWRVAYFSHFTGLILGALLVFLPPAKSWLAWIGAAFIAVAFIRTNWSPGPGITLAELGGALIVAARGPSLFNRLLSLPPLVWLGTISYGIYLWQQPIILAFPPGTPWLALFALAVASSTLAAWLSYTIVERRFRRVKAARINNPNAYGEAKA